jgi:hypothetical protein
LTITVTCDVLHDSEALFIRARSTNGTLIGDAGPAQFVSSRGRRSLTLQVITRGLSQASVQQLQVRWRWEYSSDGAAWTAFERTSHDVFLLWNAPERPWGHPHQIGRALPWRDVLDVAVGWARGATTAQAVVDRMVDGIHGLGGQALSGTGGKVKIKYGGFPIFGNTELYYLSNFISTARLENSAASSINCADCAGAVALLSSALGVPLKVVQLSIAPGRSFCTNPVQLLGRETVRRTCFDYHDFAATTRDDQAEQAWDATMKVDLDDVPSRAPHQLACARGLAMNGAPLTYPARLVAPGGRRPDATLRDGTGLRYPDRKPAHAPAADDGVRQHRRRRFVTVLAAAPVSEPAPGVDASAVLQALLVNKLAVVRPVIVETAAGERTLQRVRALVPEPVEGYQTVIFSSLSARESAADLFISLAASCSAPLVELPGLGDLSLRSTLDGTVLFLRGHSVVLVLDDGDTAERAFYIDGHLAAAYA